MNSSLDTPKPCSSVLPVASEIRCPLCGYAVGAQADRLVCAVCPLARGCDFARCPRCGYEWAKESQLLTWLRRWIRASPPP